MCLARNCLGQQGFAGSGRAYEKCSLGEFGADLHIFTGIMQKIDDFLQRFLGFVFSGNVREGDSRILLHVLLRRTLSDTSHESAAAGSPEDKSHDHPQEHNGQDIGQKEGNDHSGTVRYIAVDRHAGFQKAVCEGRRVLRYGCIAYSFRVLEVDLQSVRLDIHFLHSALFDHLYELVIADLCGALSVTVHHIADDDQRNDSGQKHDHQILAVGTFAAVSFLVVAPASVSAASSASASVAASSVVVAPYMILFLMEEHLYSA